MSFDDILSNETAGGLKDESLLQSAIRRREYNKQYQAKLRQAAKFLTLEKRIDANLNHVLGYIKTRYAKEYAAWTAPIERVVYSNSFFDNWALLASDSYKSIEEAFELSGLKEHMNFAEFERLFLQNYKLNNSGRYTMA